MAKTKEIKKVSFATDPIGKLIVRFAIPCVIALGVSSFITQIAITIVMVLFNNLLKQYGAESVYGSEIPITTMGIAM